MKIIMRSKITGSRNGEDWPEPGESMVVPDLEGADLCAQGYAIPAGAPAPEDARASESLVETRTTPKPRTRKA